MNTLHINYLLEIAKSSSINKAAQNLHISQPNLSGIIKKVETEIGYEIFLRTQNGVHTTENGRVFLESAKKIQAELDIIHSVALKNDEAKALSIASFYSSFAVQCFLDFQKNHRIIGVHDSYFEGMFEDIVERLVQKKVNIGFIPAPSRQENLYTDYLNQYNLEMYTVCRDLPVCAAMSKGHPLSKKNSITVDEFRNHPHVYYETNKICDPTIFPELKTNKEILIVSDRATHGAVLKTGNYVSVSLALSNIHKELSGLICIPIVGLEHEAQIFYIKSKHYQLSSREKKFISYVKKQFKTISLISLPPST